MVPARDQQGGSRWVRLSSFRSPEGSGWDISAGDTARPDRDQGFLGRPIECVAGGRPLPLLSRDQRSRRRRQDRSQSLPIPASAVNDAMGREKIT